MLTTHQIENQLNSHEVIAALDRAGADTDAVRLVLTRERTSVSLTIISRTGCAQ